MDIEGTIVALYCPDYMDELNTPGWHFHFVSKDRTTGGHVLELQADALSVTLDKTTGFNMVLPEDEHFNSAYRTEDQEGAVQEIEPGINE